MKFTLSRFKGNPIISPVAGSSWQSLIATNPGSWYDDASGQFLLLYRAAGNDPEHKVHFGLATSTDGFNFTRVSDTPVFSPSLDGFDAGCVEDPRIVKIGEWYYVTYASRPFPPGQYWLPKEEQIPRLDCPDDFPRIMRKNATATGLALTKDFREWFRAGRMTDPLVDDRDVILFPEKINGKFHMIHRPMEWVGEAFGTEHPAIWISSGDDLLHWTEPKLLAKAQFDWECKVGGNTPPIKTKEGWLTLYHGVGPDKHYRLGAMLLDIDDPSIVRYRTRDWIMQPEMDYEINGPYKGVIFPCGSIVKDGVFFVYYGGADKYVGVATCLLEDLLDYLRSCPVS